MIKRTLGLLLVLEGLTAAVGGRALLRWLHRSGPAAWHPWLDPLLELPEEALRGVGALELFVGLCLLRGRPRRRHPAASSGS